MCVDGILSLLALLVACSTDDTKLWLTPSANQRRNPCSGSPPVYQDLSTRHDWSVKNPIVDLPIRLKGNTKRTSGFLLSPLGAQNKDIGAASQTLLAEVKLRLRCRLPLSLSEGVCFRCQACYMQVGKTLKQGEHYLISFS